MSAAIETTNAVLASGIASANKDSTHSIADGVHTVSHATRLEIPVLVAIRAGYTDSYSTVNVLSWAISVRSIVTIGHIALHDLNALVVETGAGDDAAFVASYGPTGPGARSRFPVDRDSIVIGVWRGLR